jgi:hypothetical protein
MGLDVGFVKFRLTSLYGNQVFKMNAVTCATVFRVFSDFLETVPLNNNNNNNNNIYFIP